VRAGELAGSSDAVGGVSVAAALLDFGRLGRPDPLLERREVLTVKWTALCAKLGALALGQSRDFE
jgi:hypothetical protein